MTVDAQGYRLALPVTPASDAFQPLDPAEFLATALPHSLSGVPPESVMADYLRSAIVRSK